ncbi:16S rRNA (cytidine(1402)-2'-O)-methyltransferase [Pseudoxanthomonas composti]|uniref:Ribosomal RNA small subunit methyltransferase I n=1 Tax=Pseudoxanthomonas composti TaxID=2137479 RepID=A0A4Q1JRS1_9GAMM|nr:16S rRNA (cytidine(1402)-2'-O)-methyltransferase [Pseudoxanthomonas composti]RXR01416.1 16S rRNA (cytidine(1402)-2'-O)-methyltransferase [Pseudoxanthomonas composti]
MSAATLFVVATPIGNLADLSARALETLRTVDAICAEDTRRTGQLLSHFGIATPLVALHEHNEDAMAERIVARLQSGQSLALVSDAGTPLVSDPGYRLVKAARAAGVAVSPVPGACAAIAALSVAGLPSDRFAFEGFLPAKSAARRERLSALAGESRTLVFYESSHRIAESLADLVRALGPERPATIARELTKLFETVLAGKLAELLAKVQADDNQRKGEFVVMVQGAGEDAGAQIAEGRRVYALLNAHLPPSTAAKLAAEITGAPRKALYGSREVSGEE